ncbi:hypothetical protein TrST_g13736 [Triparma strigata]|nr:hypothetical protein TrST_g13736 [Triparma strigata]
MLYTYLLRKKVGTQENLKDVILRKILCRKKIESETDGKLDPGQVEFEKKMEDAKALKEALNMREEYEKNDPDLKALSFLYGSYEPKFWWFEIFETLRKLALTGFSVFLAPGTSAQIVMGIFMCLIATRVYCRKRLSISDFHDTFAEVAQWQLFFTMFCALAIRANLDGESLQDKVYFDVLLTVLQFLPMLVALLMSREEVVEEAKRDFEEGKESFGRAISEGNGAREKGGLELMERGGGGVRGKKNITLGSGSWTEPSTAGASGARTSKFEMENLSTKA